VATGPAEVHQRAVHIGTLLVIEVNVRI